MPSKPARAADPFSNETELLKQIALFQRKASELADARSQHQLDMRELYLRIANECRHELEALTAEGGRSMFDRVSI